MNNYANLKQNHAIRPVSILLIMLILLEICSVAMLANRLGLFAAEDKARVISLTEASEGTQMRLFRRGTDGTLTEPYAQTEKKVIRMTTLLYGGKAIATADEVQHDFDVYDGSTVWTTETPVEIFHLSYDNESGEITVVGDEDNTDKLIAPGTENQYHFSLRNKCRCNLDYTLSFEAYVEGTDHSLPVNARIVDYTGKYLVGDENFWPQVLATNGVTEKNALSAGNKADYTFEWQWPFESGGAEEDAYDTMLGDLAVNEDLTLTVVIKTVAECNENHEGGQETGDSNREVILWSLLILLALVVIIILGKMRKK